jgi:hypothetical protein
MSGPAKASLPARTCPFCGLATEVYHDSQESCIAALQEEIARTRSILASLKSVGRKPQPMETEDAPKSVRIGLD